MLFSYIANEIQKVYKVKKIYIGYLAGLLFGVILFINFAHSPVNMTSYDVIKNMLINLIGTHFFIFSIGFTAYLVSLEAEEKTLKIIRSKPVSLLYFLIGKYVTAIIYVFIFFFAYGLLSFFLSFLFFQNGDFTDMTDKVIIPAAEGFKYALSAYLLQTIASIFIVALLILFAILFENAVSAFIVTFIFLLIGRILGSKFPLYNLLPNKYLYIFNVIYQKSINWITAGTYMAIIVCYTIIVFIISYSILKHKEVKG